MTWRNNDFVLQTVTANDRRWDAGPLSAGDVFTRMFSAPGAYPYFGELHPGLAGTVQVTGGASLIPTMSPTATAPSGSPRITITLPLSGSVISGDSFIAAYTAAGVTIVPADSSHNDATGHVHLLLDQPVTLTPEGTFPRGPGIFHPALSSQVITNLTTGPHMLTVALGHGDQPPS